MKKTYATVIAVTTLLAGPAAARQVPESSDCEALRGVSIPAEAIGLPTGGANITASVSKSAASEAGAAYCQVNGDIDPVDPSAPDINFQLNLPYDWNGKGLHYGGGGYNGVLVTATGRGPYIAESVPVPLARGYATWGSDSGHQSVGLDGSFLMNEEALRNFGGDQLNKTYDVAMTVIGKFYGRGPERVYFQGASQGGHEAMIAIQRFTEDYDGAIIVHPANSFVGLQLSGHRAAKAVYQPGAWLSPEDVELLNAAVMQACDGLDGADDALISNWRACGETFDVQDLACEDGEPQHGECFGEAQIEALNTINTRTPTPPLQGGAQGFSGWPIFLGADLYGLWGMGRTPNLMNPPRPVANFGLAVLADPLIRYGILQNPDADFLAFEPASHAARITELSKILDALAADMSDFANRGGKVLLLHGTTDFAIPFGNTTAWYERVVAEMGQEATRDFMRYYVVPGFGHGSGAFRLRWQPLEALDAWVEEGQAPKNLIATDAAEATAGRTRPLCEYPEWPRLEAGANNLDAAASFECKE